MNNLGAYFVFSGRGTESDQKRAVELFRAAATQGHTTAMHNLAYCHDYAEGVDMDQTVAFKWYSQAGSLLACVRCRSRADCRMVAEVGHAPALHALGSAYQYGTHGVE